jgi:hypothetical protein
MLNTREEDPVLHGLYYWRQMINEHILIRGDEILWLAAMHPNEHKHGARRGFGTCRTRSW